MKIKTIFYIIFNTLFISSFAQRTITGTIFDSQTNESIPGAIVLIEGTNVSSTTDASGVFSLSTDSSKISIICIGYTKKQIQVTETDNIKIAIEPLNGSLETVVVTASRESQKRTEAPMAIAKISAQLIADTKPIALNEIISKAPGVFMMRLTGEGHSMSIRQPLSTNAYFLYMEDGIPVRPMGLFNHNGLIESNIMALNSIEIVRGPASSIYGPEAVGGAINLITKRPTTVPAFSAGYQGDQYNYNRFQYSGSGMISKKIGLFVGGFFGGQKNGWRERTDYQKNSVNAKVEYNVSSRTLLTAAFAYNQYAGQEGLSIDSIAYYSRTYEASNDFMYRNITAYRSSLNLKHKWNDHAESFITAFHRFNDYQMSPNHTVRWTTGSATATSEKNKSIFNSYGAIAQHSQRFDKLRSKLIVGGSYDFTPQEYDAYRIDLTTVLRPGGKTVQKYLFKEDRPDILISNYDAKVQSMGVYAQLETNITKMLKLSLGGRYDLFEFKYKNYLDNTSGKKSYNQFSPKVGLTYDLGKNNGVYANYSLGFAPPGVTAIFRKKPNAVDGDEFYYNLQPAKFTNMEIGGWISLLKDKLMLDISVYKLDGRNELLAIRQPDNSTDFQSAGKTLHQGIEFGLSAKPIKDLVIRVGGASAIHKFVDFQLSTKVTDPVQKLDGYNMPASPAFTGNSEIIYKPSWFKGFRISAEWQLLTSWYINQINTVKYEDKGFLGAKGVSLLNLRMGYQWKGIEIFVNALNVTDELYAASLGRGNAATDRTTYNPGAPRTIGFGVQYNFVGKTKQ